MKLYAYCLMIVLTFTTNALLPTESPDASEFSTLSLHDALPIFAQTARRSGARLRVTTGPPVPARRCWWFLSHSTPALVRACADRKSTRLNSSHLVISYAVFCVKKKIYLEWILIDVKFITNEPIP